MSWRIAGELAPTGPWVLEAMQEHGSSKSFPSSAGETETRGFYKISCSNDDANLATAQ